MAPLIRNAIGAITKTLKVSGCRGFAMTPQADPVLAPAWSAWRQGDFVTASRHARELTARPATASPGHHILALVAHVTGDHRGAISHYSRVQPRYRWLAQLDDPILWSYVHLGDIAGAQSFAARRGRGPRTVTGKRLQLSLERPMSVHIDGVVEAPFTDDRLSPIMPGISARLNGHSIVARVDTGGSYVTVFAEQAAELGIETVACEQEFAALSSGRVCYGVTDLELGPIRISQVPVLVLHHHSPAKVLADAFGVELGPIIGTNVLQQFLCTLDAPQQRLLLSRRGDSASRAQHLGRLGGSSTEVPFAMLNSHYMIVRGSVGDYDNLNWFVDSGLVAYNTEQGQAAVLARESALREWQVPRAEPNCFANLPGALALGTAQQRQMTAMSVPDKTWNKFGDWGGIRVDALLSWGFLRKFAWTLDFDHYVYLLQNG